MAEGWKPLAEARWRAPGAQAPDRAMPPNAAQRALIGLARATPLHRGLFRPAVAGLVFALGGGRPFDAGFRGATFRLEGGSNLMEHGVMLHPRYNEADIAFLESAVEGSVFIDIGSNIGLYALPLARKASRVIAIDANPLMAARLMRNAALSGLANVTMLATAVSDRPGAAALAVRKDDDAIVRIEEADGGDIPVTTLADIVAGNGIGRIGGLKIDIEGHEDKALAPFLNACEPALLPGRIVIEHVAAIGEYPACAAAFAARGYRLMGRTRNNSLYERAA